MTEPMTQAHLDDDRCADLMLGLLPDAERELSVWISPLGLKYPGWRLLLEWASLGRRAAVIRT